MNKRTFVFAILLLAYTPALSALHPDSVEIRKISSGVTHYYYSLDGPIKINVIEVDLTSQNLSIDIGIANDFIAHGGERTSDYVKRNQSRDGIIVAAVNGDFFGGEPHQAENCMIIKGEFVKGVKLNRTLFGVSAGNVPFHGIIRFEGNLLTSTDTVRIDALNNFPEKNQISVLSRARGEYVHIPDYLQAVKLIIDEKLLPNKEIDCTIEQIVNDEKLFHIEDNEIFIVAVDSVLNELVCKINSGSIKIILSTNPLIPDIYSLIGGLPGLIDEGVSPSDFQGLEGMSSMRFIDKNPRTAVGYSKDKSKLYLIAVDGRQENFSIGMSLYELSEFLLSIGCYNAVNLDGGGSTTMVVRDSIVNSPSDLMGERPVHNYLMVTDHTDMSMLVREIDIKPDSLVLEKYGHIDFVIEVKDGFYFALPVLSDSLILSPDNIEGKVSPEGFTAGGKTGEGYIYLDYFGLKDSIFVLIK